MTHSLAIPVGAVAVQLRTLAGALVEALVFLHTQSGHHIGAETLGERLGGGETLFLPCETAGGLTLFNLDQVAYLECPPGLPEVEALDETSSFRAAATLEMVSGQRLSGKLRYRLPDFACRVSDLLNAAEERFLLLTTPNHCFYVNRAAIVSVRMESSPCR